jgi:GntR family transcriptional regulator
MFMIVYGSAVIDFRPDIPRWVQVTDTLRARITTGVYRPGQVLPSEKQLVQEFGIARGTARRAIATLRDEGLIYTVPHLGSFVSQR